MINRTRFDSRDSICMRFARRNSICCNRGKEGSLFPVVLSFVIHDELSLSWMVGPMVVCPALRFLSAQSINNCLCLLLYLWLSKWPKSNGLFLLYCTVVFLFKDLKAPLPSTASSKTPRGDKIPCRPITEAQEGKKSPTPTTDRPTEMIQIRWRRTKQTLCKGWMPCAVLYGFEQDIVSFNLQFSASSSKSYYWTVGPLLFSYSSDGCIFRRSLSLSIPRGYKNRLEALMAFGHF